MSLIRRHRRTGSCCDGPFGEGASDPIGLEIAAAIVPQVVSQTVLEFTVGPTVVSKLDCISQWDPNFFSKFEIQFNMCPTAMFPSGA